jgi:hypothetical protein
VVYLRIAGADDEDGGRAAEELVGVEAAGVGPVRLVEDVAGVEDAEHRTRLGEDGAQLALLAVLEGPGLTTRGQPQVVP